MIQSRLSVGDLNEGDLIITVSRAKNRRNPGYRASSGIYAGKSGDDIGFYSMMLYDPGTGSLKPPQHSYDRFSINEPSLIHLERLKEKDDLSQFAESSFSGAKQRLEASGKIGEEDFLRFLFGLYADNKLKGIEDLHKYDVLAVSTIEAPFKDHQMCMGMHKTNFPLRVYAGLCTGYSWYQGYLTLNEHFDHHTKKSGDWYQSVSKKHNTVKLKAGINSRLFREYPDSLTPISKSGCVPRNAVRIMRPGHVGDVLQMVKEFAREDSSCTVKL